MRIAAVLEDFNCSGGINGDSQESAERLVWRRLASAIREKTGAESVLTVMAGDFLEDAFPAAEEKYRRAEAALSMGMDLVLELPVSVCLSDPATKAFSGLSMLKRLYRVDDLVVLCRHENGSRLSELADFIFRASPGYQAELKKCLKREPDFFAAQAQAVGAFFPEAAGLLSDPVNQRAIEILKARYQLYWMIKPVFLDVAELECDVESNVKSNVKSKVATCEIKTVRAKVESLLERVSEKVTEVEDDIILKEKEMRQNGEVQAKRKLTPEQNLAFGRAFHALLKRLSASEWKRRLEETPDGGPELLERLQQKTGLLQEQQGLEEMIQVLVSDTLSEQTIRTFLMKLLIGIQRGNLIICGLRANCPYVRVLGVRGSIEEKGCSMEQACSKEDLEASGWPALRAIQEKSWVPILVEPKEEVRTAEKRQGNLDECGQMLAALDDRAHELYLMAVSDRRE